MKVIPEFSGVGQGLDDTVHEAGVAKVDQPCKTRQAHLLLLFFLVAFSDRRRVGHGLHHAGRLRLTSETYIHLQTHEKLNFVIVIIFTTIIINSLMLIYRNCKALVVLQSEPSDSVQAAGSGS